MPSTPGVYVEEISLLPPSVAEVSTAIPAFIGHTEKSPHSVPTPTPVSSIREYTDLFGGPDKTIVTAALAIDKWGNDKYLMYYQVSMFFRNGGGKCYIVSVGNYTTEVTPDVLRNGIAALDKEDEPTLVLVPDAIGLAPVSGANNTQTYPAYSVCNTVLQHCSTRKDRFGLFDVKLTEVEEFRNAATVSASLSYGAAYTPFLQTSIGFMDDYVELKTPKKTLSALQASDMDADRKLYNEIRAFLSRQIITLPPCGAIAGMYARVDRERGVWKAPANEGLIDVIAPDLKISDSNQETLNIHSSGRSVNAIRSFPGQGTLVWGARTLDGNGLQWKYINVRRLFIMIEESIQKATRFAVFEPNTASTWLKVKAMCDSYLFGLWQQGALAGASPKQAYFVNIGLGQTMNQDDILNGRMNVEIGVAAARPAEFITLRFSHKMQEA